MLFTVLGRVSISASFLALPTAWKASLAQYVGRLHRPHPGKKEVRVFDYVDRAVPTLASMFEKRLRSYRSIGYNQGELPEQLELLAEEWPGTWVELDEPEEDEGAGEEP